jgi:sensor histidine kinase YesM
MTFSLRSFVAIAFLSFFLFSQTGSVMAQDFPVKTLQKLDSLNRIIKSKSHDTLKILALLDIADTYALNNMDTTFLICKKAERMSERLGYKRGLANCYNLFAYVLQATGDDDSALVYLLKCNKIDRELNDKMGLAGGITSIGAIYHQKGDMIRALQYYYEALAINEQIEYKKGIMNTVFNIGTLLYRQGQEKEALAYYFRCLKIAQEIKNDEFISNAITGIATIYRYRLVALYDSNGDIDSIIAYRSKVLLYYNRAAQHDKQSNFIRLYASDLNALGITHQRNFLYLQKNKYPKDTVQASFDRTINYYNKSFEIAKAHNYRQLQSYNLQYMAHMYMSVNDLARAEPLALKSLKIAEEIKSPVNIRQTSQTLYNIYKLKKDYPNALKMHERYVTLKDSMFNEETKSNTLKKQFEYETEKKEQENVLLSQKNEIQQLELSRREYFIYGMGSIIVLILIVSFLFIRQSRIISRQKTMKLEQRLLRSQMNPHFIFNSLMAIQSFIYKNEPRESGKYLASFAKLVRAILENSREEYITLSKEIQWLENYLKLQQLRFDNKFDYEIDTAEDLDKDITLLPPMLTQPAIENALEHGLKNIDYKGFIQVEFKKEKNYLVVRVKDNGVGISVSSVAIDAGADTDKHTSLSTVITKERLQLLNRRKFRKIMFDIKPVEPKGTLITFSIPL